MGVASGQEEPKADGSRWSQERGLGPQSRYEQSHGEIGQEARSPRAVSKWVGSGPEKQGEQCDRLEDRKLPRTVPGCSSQTERQAGESPVGVLPRARGEEPEPEVESEEGERKILPHQDEADGPVARR